MFKLIFTVLVLLPLIGNAKIDRLQNVVPGVWRGSQPTALKDFDQLQEMGIKTIINLQWDSSVENEREIAESRGIKFINVPMKARDWPSDTDIKKIFDSLLNEKNHPVFLHCRMCKDRTGLIFALFRVEVMGWTPDKAYKEWIDFGFAHQALHNLRKYFMARTGYKPPAFKKCVPKLTSLYLNL